jgi:hypothetical protein
VVAGVLERARSCCFDWNRGASCLNQLLLPYLNAAAIDSTVANGHELFVYLPGVTGHLKLRLWLWKVFQLALIRVDSLGLELLNMHGVLMLVSICSPLERFCGSVEFHHALKVMSIQHMTITESSI